MEWLTRTPIDVVTAHLKMLRPLVAEEMLEQASAVGVGCALRPGPWASDHINRWEAETQVEENQVDVRVAAAASGIKIKVLQNG